MEKNYFQNFHKKLENKYIFISFALMLLFIGGIIGSEYRKYQIASSIKEGLQMFSQGMLSDKNTTEEKKKDMKIFKKGEAFIYTGRNNDEELRVKVREILQHGKEFNTGVSKYTGNNLIAIRVESENTGKKQSGYNPSSDNLIFITQDGFEYGAKTYMLNVYDNLPEGYQGCVGCATNPGEKMVSDILFDIPEDKIDGGKLFIKRENIAFEL